MGQSLESILENFLIDFEGIGNGALEIVKGIDGKPTQLNHIPAKTIRRSKDFKVLRHKIGTEEIFYRQVGIEDTVDQKETATVDNAERALLSGEIVSEDRELIEMMQHVMDRPRNIAHDYENLTLKEAVRVVYKDMLT